MGLFPIHQWPAIKWMLMAVMVTICLTGVGRAETYRWEDVSQPFKQTFRFSTAATAVIRVSIPARVLAESGRISLVCRMEKNSPRLRPYLIVNKKRAAFYYLGGNGVVNLKAEHLVAGENELMFGDQTSTGDLIFVYDMRFHLP